MKTAAEILHEHGIAPSPSGKQRYYTTCPVCSARRSRAHQKSACLGVTIKDDGVTWGCNHCLWTGGAYYNGKINGRGGSPAITYDFTDERGELLFQKVRNPPGSGQRFWQRRPNGKGEWINNTQGVRKVLYRLPEVIEAIASERTIIVVEGEKDADSLWHIGIPATCSPDGAADTGKTPKWRPEYSEALRGADIVVIPDHDSPGYEHANATAKMLAGVAKCARMFTLAKHWPECPKGGDISDWLAAGHKREELDALIAGAPDEPGAKGLSFPSITTLDDWLNRELALADPILGHWLTTTSRVLLTAPTGIGKTMFGVAIGISIPANTGFLHWRAVRPARVFDGEMSRRLMRERLADEVRRSGVSPQGMHILSHEDVEGFRPLNTPEGQAYINNFIERIGGIDLIMFDNVMSLIAGDHKDEEGWRLTLPWIRSLTRRSIGQIWIHHTGHDESRGYGTKTREWEMDTVVHLDRIERPDTDVSFLLSFKGKARERTPTTRDDFEDVKIALVNDRWISDVAEKGRKLKISPLGMKFLGALTNATADSEAKMFGCPAATIEEWRAECSKIGLLEKDTKERSARSLFDKYKRELIAANQTACNETMAWLLPA
jgi:hypothetical protein